MALVIVLNAEHLTRLASIAKASLPNESCAFLLGRSEQPEEPVVVEVMPMRNSEQSPYSFSISPEELLQAYELAEQKALQVVGIFHSHPGDPSPSSTDKKFMEINPVVWVIYSTTQQEFRAYIGDERIREVDIKVRG